MPLYKRKTKFQNCLDNKLLRSTQETETNKNGLRRENEVSTASSQQFKKRSAEFCISFDQHEQNVLQNINGSNKINSNDDTFTNTSVIKENLYADNKRNADYKKIEHLFGNKTIPKQSEVKQTSPKRNKKTISNTLKDVKKKSDKPSRFKAIKNKEASAELDINNNIETAQRIKTKGKSTYVETKISAKKRKHAKKDDTSSELENSIVSLWTQDEIRKNTEPPEHYSHYERLVWLQENRNIGLYVCCDKCNKFRYLKDTVDPLELPEKWYCNMNPDKQYSKCSVPEVEIKSWEEEDLIYNTYHAGSIVWAKLEGYPWWPAMVDDDPDTEMYYWLDDYSYIPTYYHVVFFDSKTVTRAWLKPNALIKFSVNIENPIYQVSKRNMFKSRIAFAKEQGRTASQLSVPDRLKKYSFLARWSGPINTPVDAIVKGRSENKHKRNGIKHTKKGNIKNNRVKKYISKNNFEKSPQSMLKDNGTRENLQSFVDRNYISPDIFQDELLNGTILSFKDAEFDEL